MNRITQYLLALTFLVGCALPKQHQLETSPVDKMVLMKLYKDFEKWRIDSFGCYLERVELAEKYFNKGDSVIWYSMDSTNLLHVLGSPNSREETIGETHFYYWLYLMPDCEGAEIVLNSDSLRKNNTWPEKQIFFIFRGDSLERIMAAYH